MLGKLRKNMSSATNFIKENTIKINIEKAFDENKGKVKELVKKECPGLVQETIRSDSGSLMVAKTIHMFLPMPIQLTISEEGLAKFLQSNSESILA
jgi:hypothetical protein